MTASSAIDVRSLLARPDLAELALEGLYPAQTYRPTRPFTCIAGSALVLDGPEGEVMDQIIFGEVFDVLETTGPMTWGRARRDGVVGFVAVSALEESRTPPTHRVSDLAAEVRSGPDVDFPVVLTLPMNALVTIESDTGGWGAMPGQGWIETRALKSFHELETEPVEVARRLEGAAHRSGWRTPDATDCAGLVQQALYACGLAGPRYADLQADLGREIDPADKARGDLVIWLHEKGGPGWSGHSAFMLDADRVLHASGDRGGVVIESLLDADARYLATGFSPAVFRRLTA
ncbi:peptidoglycan endopeptidase [Rhizobium sp. CRIBSB]|nr:peptidoglycan endopeptidase [Rhizobium sp. CRIBSB]